MAQDPEIPKFTNRAEAFNMGKKQEGREAVEFEGKNRRWRQERRGNRVPAIVKVFEPTAVLQVDMKLDSRERPSCKVWRALA